MHDRAMAALYGVTANVFLGLSSLYWKSLGSIAPVTLLVFRVFLSLITLILLMVALRQFRGWWHKVSGKACAIHAGAAGLVVLNWGSFIWASIHGHVIESGLGYLAAPLVAIFLGALFLKERLSRPKSLAIVLIAVSVSWLALTSGELAHWVYLVIGVTWGGYACLKKMTPLDSIGGLFTETLFLAALSPIAVALTDIRITLPVELDLNGYILLFACGAVSVFPLFLFAKAASTLPLSVMGLFQFVLPTTQLAVALLVYKQAVSANTLGCFGFIWVALSIIVLEPVLGSVRKRMLSLIRPLHDEL